jgi:hypothetical protein
MPLEVRVSRMCREQGYELERHGLRAWHLIDRRRMLSKRLTYLVDIDGEFHLTLEQIDTWLGRDAPYRLRETAPQPRDDFYCLLEISDRTATGSRTQRCRRR